MINSRNSFYFVLGLILIAAFSRIIPHYPNFTPLCAIALFGAKYFRNKFEKLKVFYRYGLGKVGWDRYSMINLKYHNQVVCTKR